MNAVPDLQVRALEDFGPDDMAVAVSMVDGVVHCRPEREWSKARELRLQGKLLGISRSSVKKGQLFLVIRTGWHTPEPAVG